MAYSTGDPALPTRRARLIVAALIGAVAALFVLATLAAREARLPDLPVHGADFTFWWRAARALLAHENPYEVIRPVGRYPFDGVFVYPLPAAAVTLPLALLPVRLAAALFVAFGFALAAYGLSAAGWWRLVVLASAPALRVFESAQWSPLLLGAALVPSFGWLLACKPTIGAALFAAWPRRATVVGGALLALLCLLLLPTWPRDWLATTLAESAKGQYVAPVGFPGGIVLLLALVRWRRPEARLLAALACVPQNYFFYDQLYLFLVPAGPASAAALALWSHLIPLVSLLGVLPEPPAGWIPVEVGTVYLGPYVVWGLYLPCLLMVLRRPNVGPVPAALERWLARRGIPVWLRGRPSAAS